MGVPQPAHLQPTPLQASSGSAAFLMCQSQRVGQELGPLFAPLLPALAFLGGISLHSRPSWKVSAQTRCLHFLLVPACLDHPVTKVYSLALHCKQIKDGKCVTIKLTQVEMNQWSWELHLNGNSAFCIKPYHPSLLLPTYYSSQQTKGQQDRWGQNFERQHTVRESRRDWLSQDPAPSIATGTTDTGHHCCFVLWPVPLNKYRSTPWL